MRATPVQFDLPAQPAATALAAFARQAGVEVLYSFDDLKKVRSTAVAGAYEPEAAIALLLRGTGFKATQNSSRKFLVVRVDATALRGEIRGVVLSQRDDQPIAGAIVRLADATTGVRTRSDGGFVLRDVPPEIHALLVHAEGFTTARVADIAVRPEHRADLGRVRLTVQEGTQRLEELVVSADHIGVSSVPLMLSLQRLVVTPSRYGITQERGTIAATLTETDLLALPQLGDDLYRAISHLPGLAADDLTARFWVRGAPHEHVLARLDGVDLIEPFHLKDTRGSLSILDLETISRLDLYTGGFTSEFGDKLGAVLTMETDSHVRARMRSTLGLSFTGAHVANRGQARNGRHRWLVSGRSGYPDLAIDASDNGGGELRPRYYDVMGKWEFNLTPNHVLSFHALHAGDRLFFQDEDGPVLTSRYDSDYFWVRWQAEFGALKGETVLSHSHVNWRRDGEGLLEQRYALVLHDGRNLRSVALRQDWNAEASERMLFRGGFEVRSGRADYDYESLRERVVFRSGGFRIERLSNRAAADPHGENASLHFATRVRPTDQVILEPGLRYDSNNYADDSDVSPRLNVAYHHGRSTWRAAWGVYTQAQGLQQLAVAEGDVSFHRAERAEHRVLSFEHRLKFGVNVRLEAYERISRRTPVRWENVVEATDAIPELEGDHVRIEPVRGHARGIELITERRGHPRWSWSASYAFAKAEETLRSGLTIPRARDQRHSFNFDATWTPSPKWQFSVAWQYHTGWPITDLMFSRVTLTDGSSAIVNTLGPLYGQVLPNYQRVDFRAQRRFELKRGVLRVYLDIFNALDRENRIDYAYDVRFAANGGLETTRKGGESMFPRLPSLGITWDF